MGRKVDYVRPGKIRIARFWEVGSSSLSDVVGVLNSWIRDRDWMGMLEGMKGMASMEGTRPQISWAFDQETLVFKEHQMRINKFRSFVCDRTERAEAGLRELGIKGLGTVRWDWIVDDISNNDRLYSFSDQRSR